MSANIHQRGKKWDGRSTLSSTTQWQRDRMRGTILPMQRPSLWQRLQGK